MIWASMICNIDNGLIINQDCNKQLIIVILTEQHTSPILTEHVIITIVYG